MGQLFEVVVFTASLAEVINTVLFLIFQYAEPLVKILDETGAVVQMLYRQHCTPLNGIYVKDLSRLGRNMKDVILIDVSGFLVKPNIFLEFS